MKKQKTPALVNLAIYTTITVFLWIFFDVYRALKKPTVLDIDTKILEPINPNLNKNALEEINKRTFYDEETFDTIVIPTIETIEEPEISSDSGSLN